MKATINARYYREAGAFVTTKQSRYSLNSIRIEPHPDQGALIVATDGFTLGIFHDREGECDEPVSLYYKEWLSGLCRDGQALTVNEDGSIDLHGGSQIPSTLRLLGLVDESPRSFPSWRTVIPVQSESKPTAINAKYLSRFNLGDELGRPVSLFANDPESQIVVTKHNRNDFVGILMPCRGEESYPSSFLDPLRTGTKTSRITEGESAE